MARPRRADFAALKVLASSARRRAAYVHLQTFQDFPPRQKPGSFSIDQAMEKLMNQKSNN